MNIGQFKSAAVVIGALAVIVLAVIAVLGQFETTLRDDTTLEENISIASGAGQLTATEEVYAFTGLANASTGGYYILNNISDDILNYTTQGVISTPLPDDTYTATYSYLKATTESDSAQTFQNGMIVFATFVGVLVLAMVGAGIVKLYKK